METLDCRTNLKRTVNNFTTRKYRVLCVSQELTPEWNVMKFVMFRERRAIYFLNSVIRRYPAAKIKLHGVPI